MKLLTREELREVQDKHFSPADAERSINVCDIQNWEHLFWNDDWEWIGDEDDIHQDIQFVDIMLRYERTRSECIYRLMNVLSEQSVLVCDQLLFIGDFMDLHFWGYFGVEKPRNNAYVWEMDMCLPTDKQQYFERNPTKGLSSNLGGNSPSAPQVQKDIGVGTLF